MALWFVLPATALGAAALDDSASMARRRRALLAAGALIGLATTLKPYFGLMGIPLLLVGALTVPGAGHRLAAARHLVLGGLLGAVPALVFTLLLGSLRHYLREGFVHGPIFVEAATFGPVHVWMPR